MDSTKIKGVLSNIDGLGPKAVESIEFYFNNNTNKETILKLINILDIQSYQKPIMNNKFSGKNIVFTGKLSRLSREEAKYKALQLGAKILNSVSKNTDFLICGEKSGNKIAKARELNIQILSEREWISMIK
jgi:DNA ligase (NAD+)